MKFTIRFFSINTLILCMVFAGARTSHAGTGDAPLPVAAGVESILPPAEMASVPAPASATLNAPAPLPLENTAKASPAIDPIRDLITRQMDAIRARDAEAAFAQTAAALHDHYPTAKKFLSHIRFEQRPLYNHNGFTFLDRHEIEGGVLQKISVSDSFSDSPVTAVFRLEQDAGGRWLIVSCAILDDYDGDKAEPI